MSSIAPTGPGVPAPNRTPDSAHVPSNVSTNNGEEQSVASALSTASTGRAGGNLRRSASYPLGGLTNTIHTATGAGTVRSAPARVQSENSPASDRPRDADESGAATAVPGFAKDKADKFFVLQPKTWAYSSKADAWDRSEKRDGALGIMQSVFGQNAIHARARNGSWTAFGLNAPLVSSERAYAAFDRLSDLVLGKATGGLAGVINNGFDFIVGNTLRVGVAAGHYAAIAAVGVSAGAAGIAGSVVGATTGAVCGLLASGVPGMFRGAWTGGSAIARLALERANGGAQPNATPEWQKIRAEIMDLVPPTRSQIRAQLDGAQGPRGGNATSSANAADALTAHQKRYLKDLAPGLSHEDAEIVRTFGALGDAIVQAVNAKTVEQGAAAAAALVEAMPNSVDALAAAYDAAELTGETEAKAKAQKCFEQLICTEAGRQELRIKFQEAHIKAELRHHLPAEKIGDWLVGKSEWSVPFDLNWVKLHATGLTKEDTNSDSYQLIRKMAAKKTLWASAGAEGKNDLAAKWGAEVNELYAQIRTNQEAMTYLVKMAIPYFEQNSPEETTRRVAHRNFAKSAYFDDEGNALLPTFAGEEVRSEQALTPSSPDDVPTTASATGEHSRDGVTPEG